ncbi:MULTISPECIES: hypothetical protein [Gordonia]|uniref:hypothetical protein n=1 Tax=Gordonia TaxID=2053 RepID=UPI0002A64441|nr:MULTISPECIES: hypothetical protein [Gordonia]KAF0968581.1 hypothetical protein BPODLACK_02946 [Gordonia sp. YY1]MCR8898936.1 hypothetical protein [Gordonia sp. GONU]MCZ0911793.1 hypothetical protein [Gordonia amicalis]MCZ4579308.1 hypothetical protein [Gordonia amicalis]MDV7101834.1 hypothetical protein [Gordonia amicalis]
MNPVIQRRVQLGLLVVGLTITAMALSLIAGCFKNDSAIEASKATVMAEVVSVDALHAAVDFQTPDGSFHSPRFGLLYPTELSEGQRISVEYAAYNPDLARPTGRTAMLSIIPGLSVAVVGWLVVGLLMVGVAEFSRRLARRNAEKSGGDDSAGADSGSDDSADADLVGENADSAAAAEDPVVDVVEDPGPGATDAESLSPR